jgi:hypothetical protein
VRCGGIVSTWREIRTLSRRYLPISTSGARYVPTGIPRRRSPGARWECPRWRWKCSVSTRSCRPSRAYARVPCGRTTGWSSLRPSGRSSMRRMCAGRSEPSAGKQASARTGRRANCDTHLSLCCQTTEWRSRRSAASWATVRPTSPRRSTATRSGRSSRPAPRRERRILPAHAARPLRRPAVTCSPAR